MVSGAHSSLCSPGPHLPVLKLRDCGGQTVPSDQATPVQDGAPVAYLHFFPICSLLGHHRACGRYTCTDPTRPRHSNNVSASTFTPFPLFTIVFYPSVLSPCSPILPALWLPVLPAPVHHLRAVRSWCRDGGLWCSSITGRQLWVFLGVGQGLPASHAELLFVPWPSTDHCPLSKFWCQGPLQAPKSLGSTIPLGLSPAAQWVNRGRGGGRLSSWTLGWVGPDFRFLL